MMNDECSAEGHNCCSHPAVPARRNSIREGVDPRAAPASAPVLAAFPRNELRPPGSRPSRRWRAFVTRHSSFVILFFALGSPALAADAWPQFRGPRGDGSSDARGLPLTGSETNHVRWKPPIHGRSWSSPVLWGSQIWLPTATEDGLQ